MKSITQAQVPYKSKDVNPIKCICCGKDIHLLNPDWESDSTVQDPTTANWNDGIIQSVVAGYGSCLDGNVYLIGICDNCLENKTRDGSAIFLYDYISNHKIKERRKFLNKVLHRRMKLRRLLKND